MSTYLSRLAAAELAHDGPLPAGLRDLVWNGEPSLSDQLRHAETELAFYRNVLATVELTAEQRAVRVAHVVRYAADVARLTAEIRRAA